MASWRWLNLSSLLIKETATPGTPPPNCEAQLSPPPTPPSCKGLNPQMTDPWRSTLKVNETQQLNIRSFLGPCRSAGTATEDERPRRFVSCPGLKQGHKPEILLGIRFIRPQFRDIHFYIFLGALGVRKRVQFPVPTAFESRPASGCRHRPGRLNWLPLARQKPSWANTMRKYGPSWTGSLRIRLTS